MRKILTAGAAALALIGGSAATVSPATAAPGHFSGGRDGGFHGGFRGDRGFRGDGALAAGVIGFGLGAALAGPGYGYGYGYPYGYGYGYGSPYGYGYDYGYGSDYYGTCYARERVWDPYAGRYVIERVPYAC